MCADQQASQTEPPVKPSDDVAPNHGVKREEVKADMPLSQVSKDMADDDKKNK